MVIISGQLSEGANQLVTLDLMGPTSFIPIDSVRCDENGSFSITFETEQMNYYSLKYTKHGYVTIIAKPGDRIKISGSAESIYPYTIEGSRPSKLVNQLATNHKEVLDELRKISVQTETLKNRPGFSAKKASLDKAFDSITNAFYQYSKAFIYENAESPALLIALNNQFGPGLPVFDPMNDLNIYRFTDSVLYEKYPKNKAVRALHNELATAYRQMLNQKTKVSIEEGDKAPDFIIQSINNEPVSLSDFKGNYVLLHFWASWSPPSIEENTYLKNALENYTNKKFVIIQVSLDDQREKWKNTIPEKKENWYHVSELKRWEGLVGNMYDVQRIPANFLISPDGIILETDIFGDQIDRMLQSYL